MQGKNHFSYLVLRDAYRAKANTQCDPDISGRNSSFAAALLRRTDTVYAIALYFATKFYAHRLRMFTAPIYFPFASKTHNPYNGFSQ